MELKATRFAIDGHVATVWLHRPERHNAWTGRMHTEYRWILAQLDRQPEVRVVVVTGTPPAFCVGGDSDALAMALDYARQLATGVGPAALATTKAQLYADLLRHDVGAAIDDAQRLLAEAMTTAEYREGVAALRERRPPAF